MQVIYIFLKFLIQTQQHLKYHKTDWTLQSVTFITEEAYMRHNNFGFVYLVLLGPRETWTSLVFSSCLVFAVVSSSIIAAERLSQRNAKLIYNEDLLTNWPAGSCRNE